MKSAGLTPSFCTFPLLTFTIKPWYHSRPCPEYSVCVLSRIYFARQAQRSLTLEDTHTHLTNSFSLFLFITFSHSLTHTHTRTHTPPTDSRRRFIAAQSEQKCQVFHQPMCPRPEKLPLHFTFAPIWIRNLVFT